MNMVWYMHIIKYSIWMRKKELYVYISIQFSHSVMFNSATSWTATRQASLSTWPTPGACSNSCPSSWWCHPTISSSVALFSSCLQSFPASGSFQMSWFLVSGGQSIRSFSFSISPSSEYSGLISFRMDWFNLLAIQGAFKSLLQHHTSKESILRHSLFFMVQLTSIHDYWKNHSLNYMDLCWQSNVSAF